MTKNPTNNNNNNNTQKRKCSVCGLAGHNARTCAKEAKEKAGCRKSFKMWEVADLKVHPLNKEAMPRLEGAQGERLRADIAKRGVDDPLHVVIDADGKTGLVLAGAERLDAARAADLAKVPVIVRDDLGDDEMAQLRFLIGSNHNRKGLTEGQLVLAYLPLESHHQDSRKNAPGKDGEKFIPEGTKTAEVMAKLVDVSPSHWNRASKLVREHEAGHAPIARLYLDGVLCLYAARKAASLPEKVQEEIVQSLNRDKDVPLEDRRRQAKAAIKSAAKAAIKSAHEEVADKQERVVSQATSPPRSSEASNTPFPTPGATDAEVEPPVATQAKKAAKEASKPKVASKTPPNPVEGFVEIQEEARHFLLTHMRNGAADLQPLLDATETLIDQAKKLSQR